MGIADDYSNAVWNEMRRFATWQPNDSVELGTYGVWNGAVFVPAGKLADLAHPPAAVVPGTAKPLVQHTFQSAETSSFEFHANANVTWPPGGSGTIATVNPGMSISFKSANQFWVNLGGADEIAIDNLAQIMDELVRRAQLPETHPDHWQHAKYRVVTRITRAQRFAIAMSRSNEAGVQLEATGGVGPSGADWFSGSLTTDWARTSGAVASWDGPGAADQAYAPFFSLCHVYVEPLGKGWQVTGGCGQ